MAATATPVLRCAGLTKRFGERTAVDDVSLTIAGGETYGLLGPNGAGKTTTISMLCGLTPADAGTVEVAGRPMHPGAVDAKASVGYVPQDIALYPDLSARENLTFFGKLQGIAKAQLRRRVAEVLDIVGLTDRADEHVDSYSGGMKRRANIAVGLLHEPELLVLDEPTVGVDPQSRNQILESIDRLGGAGLAVLYTTHYMEEAERLCDRVGIIDEGRLVAEGTRAELVARLGEHARVRIEGSGDLTGLVAEASERGLAVRGSTTDGAADLVVAEARRALAPLVELADDLGVDVGAVEVREPDLEAVFLHLTGKALRD